MVSIDGTGGGQTLAGRALLSEVGTGASGYHCRRRRASVKCVGEGRSSGKTMFLLNSKCRLQDCCHRALIGCLCHPF